jgi:serine/threonine-protein kinase
MSQMKLLNSFVGEYRITAYLGAGGMGEVYRAVHTRLGREAAIKVLNGAQADTRHFYRFFNEARIQASLRHPGIAVLYDYCELNGLPCIVMEYVDGQTLEEKIAAEGALPPAEAVRIFKAVVETVAYLHRQGIVHRDLKSNNIKLTGAGEVKLLDFGIARTDFTPNLTLIGNVVGTPHYLSPEQLGGSQADERSDIWALGVLFYEMLSGTLPFEAANILQLCDRIKKADYIPPSALNPAVPPTLEAILARCLKRHPADRYPSAQQLLAEIEKLNQELRPEAEHWAVAEEVVSRLKRRLLNLLSEMGYRGKDKSVVSRLKRRLLNLAPRHLLFVVALIVLVLVWIFGPSGNSYRHKLDPQPSPTPSVQMIRIVTLDGEAEVYQSGQLIGLTPVELKARLGQSLDLTLKRAGFREKRVKLPVTAQSGEYRFVLEPIEPPFL